MLQFHFLPGVDWSGFFATRHAPLTMGFSRQEYWSGLLCPSPGDLPDPGIEPASLTSAALAGRLVTTSATWEALVSYKPTLILEVNLF